MLFLLVMDITRSIESAEKQYKQILEEFFTSVFNEVVLPSHGIDHHRRVWNYARELVQLIPLKNTGRNLSLTSNLIIACYLHDIGMSVDPGVKHGKISKKLCKRFLKQYHLHEKDYGDVLDAIEFHDNKDYTDEFTGNELLRILSISDDLDAFGYTGVFRYLEIYLKRNFNLEKIGDLIRDNAAKRYDNFANSFTSFNELVLKHRKRYEILDNFFRKYNEQLPSYHFGTLNPYGYCGVVELFIQMKNTSIELKELIKTFGNSGDPVIKSYFSGLKKELY